CGRSVHYQPRIVDRSCHRERGPRREGDGRGRSGRRSTRRRRVELRPVPAETHVERGPLDRQQVFELIRDRLADILEVDPATITEGASFTDDLDADSLALIELVEALEEELGERTVGFRIDDEDLEDLKTVGDAVDYVVGRLGQSSP